MVAGGQDLPWAVRQTAWRLRRWQAVDGGAEQLTLQTGPQASVFWSREAEPDSDQPHLGTGAWATLHQRWLWMPRCGLLVVRG